MKIFSIFRLLPVAALLCATAAPGMATLAGTSVTGTMSFAGDPSNYFDPSYGFVPASGYLNTASATLAISNSAVEFGYDDGGNRDSANFSDAQLTISDLAEVAAGPNVAFQMTFTDSAFLGGTFTPVTNDLGLTYSLVGDTLTVQYSGGTVVQGQTLSTVFNFTPSPEPSTVGLVFMTGVVFLAGIGKSRRRE